ncbi:MAG: sulfatase [Candidatus Hermodarchaeota archaeon]
MKIFLIIFDTLRKDHTGITYGNKWIKTPNFDAFAKDCIVFDKAYPESLPTIPVRRAIHTGIRTFPFNHAKPKLRTDDLVEDPGWDPIPPHHKHIAEYLRNPKYTSAFITSTFHQFKPNMNFHLGFDQWNWIRGHEADKARAKMRKSEEEFQKDLQQYLISSKKHKRSSVYQKFILYNYLANIQDRKSEEKYFPAQTFNKAIEFVEDTAQVQNTFCFIDEFDPHEPWDPPQKYLDLYVDKSYNGRKIIQPAYSQNLRYISPEELKFMRACYAGEVSLCDAWFGKFIEKLKEMDIYNDSLIILISDHGHSIGEHNATGKIPMFMYPELVDIPFMIKPPGGINGPKRIRKSYIYNFDILPTLFGYLDKEKPEAFEGLDLSLFANEDDQILNGRNYITCGFSLCTLYKDDHYALITSNDGKYSKLFDVKKDPEWNNNIAVDNQDICVELLKKIKDDAKGDLLTSLEYMKFEELKDWYHMKKLNEDTG